MTRYLIIRESRLGRSEAAGRILRAIRTIAEAIDADIDDLLPPKVDIKQYLSRREVWPSKNTWIIKPLCGRSTSGVVSSTQRKTPGRSGKRTRHSHVLHRRRVA